MTSNNLAKKIFVLIFLLAVLAAIFIWQDNDFNQGYLKWLRTGLARLNPFDSMIGPELELAEDSGLDLSNVDIEEIIAEESEESEFVEEEIVIGEQEEEEEDEEEIVIGIGGPKEPIIEEQAKEVIVVSEKKMTLEEIEQEVSRITKEVERIDKDVQALVALAL